MVNALTQLLELLTAFVVLATAARRNGGDR